MKRQKPLQPASTQSLYRVQFHNNGQVWELYVRRVDSSSLWGFVLLEGFVFGEQSTLLIDPAEERLRAQFEGVQRSHVPAHAVIRIDEVASVGQVRISEGQGGNIMPFPAPPGPQG